MPTTLQTLTAPTEAGISRLIPDVAQRPRPSRFHAIPIPLTTTPTSRLDQQLASIPCIRTLLADKLQRVGRVLRAESA